MQIKLDGSAPYLGDSTILNNNEAQNYRLRDQREVYLLCPF